MTVQTPEELAGLRAIGRIVARVLRMMLEAAEPGMTTAELDALGRAWLEEEGARSAPKVCYDFPGWTCISVNEEIAHGIPGSRVLAPGDVLNVDVSAEKDGLFADTGGTIVVPPVAQAHERMLAATQRALEDALGEARAGAKINRIGRAIERRANKAGYRIIRNLCSHGVGRHVHEEPREIAGYYDRRDRRRLSVGDVITIEPFFSTGSDLAFEAADGWTLMNQPGGRSAQFEHSLVITKGAPILLTVER